MIKQNLLSALPFFTTQGMQTFRHPAAEGHKSKLAIACRYDRLLPWTIKHTPAATPNQVLLCKADGSEAIKLDTIITVSTQTIDSVGYVYHEGSADVNTPSTTVNKYTGDTSDTPITWDGAGTTTYAAFVGDGGYFYLDISIGSGPATRYFSELMEIRKFEEFSSLASGCTTFPHARIEAVTDCAIGDMFPAGIANKIFVLNGSVRAPQYPIDREVATDGDGNETPLWTRMRKVYAVGMLCTETVADWAASLPLYTGGGKFNITDETGWQTSGTVEGVTVDWPDNYNGMVAEVEIRFSIEAFTQSGCC